LLANSPKLHFGLCLPEHFFRLSILYWGEGKLLVNICGFESMRDAGFHPPITQITEAKTNSFSPV
jgi:hypothetical protein